MTLFKPEKKKDRETQYSWGSSAKKTQFATIKILGSGCKSCHALYENAEKAVEHGAFSAEIAYITDLENIMSYGLMSMPALVVNEKVVSTGKVLKPAEIEKLLHSLGL